MAEGTRITIGITKNLLSEIDEYANTLNINRTSAISVLLSQALAQNKALEAMNDLMPLMGKLDKLAASGVRLVAQNEGIENGEK